MPESNAPRIYWAGSLLIASLAMLPVGAASATEVKNAMTPGNEIVLGMSTALTGPIAEIGINMQAGVLAAFAEANRQGGIQGKTLRLIALDDGYEPKRTTPNMHQLLEKDRVVAIIGNAGTPTGIVAVPIAIEHRTAFYAPFSGGSALRRTPPERYVFNFRPSYADETAATVDALINVVGLKPTEIAFFTQRDTFGDAGFIGGLEALKRNGLKDENAVVHGRYERNTMAVEGALADILSAEVPVRAIVTVSTYKQSIEFIRLARQAGWDGIITSVSVGTTTLAQQLGEVGDGVVCTQIVPPLDADLPIVREYHAALQAFDASIEPSFTSLEGYIAARLFCQALRRAEDPCDRESIVDALESLGEVDLGMGVPLTLSPQQHQASHGVWLSVIRNGRIKPFQWRELAK